jgi:hypothetical protein
MVFDIIIWCFVKKRRITKKSNCSMKIIKSIYKFKIACLCWKLFQFQKVCNTRLIMIYGDIGNYLLVE